MSWRFWAWTEDQWLHYWKANLYLIRMFGRMMISLLAVFGITLLTSSSLDMSWLSGGERFSGFAQGIIVGGMWVALLVFYVLRTRK